jgi:hypothetical protein
MHIAQFNPKMDVCGYLMPRKGGPPLEVYLILKHFKSEVDVQNLQEGLEGLSSGFLGESVVRTETK